MQPATTAVQPYATQSSGKPPTLPYHYSPRNEDILLPQHYSLILLLYNDDDDYGRAVAEIYDADAETLFNP